MATMLRNIQMYLILGVILFILIIAVGIAIYVLSLRKKQSGKEVYYDSFNRKDSLEYIKFDGIFSSNPEEQLKGSGVVQQGRTYTAAINVTGYNFYSASLDEQIDTINSTISMMASLEYPVQFRQTSKAIDISYNIGVFEEIREKKRRKVLQLHDELEQAIDDANDNVDDVEVSEYYMEEVRRLKKEIERMERQYDEADEMVLYMTSSGSTNTQRVQNIIYSYDYDAGQFTQQLSEEEIYQQAVNELDNRGAALISALARCKCSARRCSAEEYTDLMRRHMHPLTGDEVSIKDLYESDINSLFVTSETMFNVVKNKMGEEMYMRSLAAYETKLKETLKRQELSAEKQEVDRLDKTVAMAEEQLDRMNSRGVIK